MHLLQAGVNLVYIRDLLGHADFIAMNPLHSHLDKVAKSMRKEDAPYVKLQSNRFNQPERRRWKDHHGGQSGRGSGTAG